MATYELISSISVGSGGAANITFSSIPQTYTDLLLSFSLRSAQSASTVNAFLRVNGSATDYLDEYFGGSGGSAFASPNGGATTNIYCGEMNGASSVLTNTFCNNQVYIPNYTGSTVKLFSCDGVQEDQASTGVYTNLSAGRWNNTSAITSLEVRASSGNLVEYSTAYLYGISNA